MNSSFLFHYKHNRFYVGIRRERDSNMELFRVFAMFLVLVVHSDFFSLGAPTNEDLAVKPIPSFIRLLFQGLSIGCVNMFVLLSGWYGIRSNKRSFSNFLFQCAYFLVGIYVMCLLFHVSDFNLTGIKGCLLLLNWNWFIKAYVLLYILAPVLNAYIDSVDERKYRMLLIGFFSFQTILSWYMNAVVFFEHGYSTIFFIGLYLLARYMAKYGGRITDYGRQLYLSIYLVSSLLLVVLYYLAETQGIGYCSIVFQYDNPLVIIAAFSLMLYFSKLKFKSRFVNWLGASSFAVFLLHTNPNLCLPYFVPMVKSLYSSCDGVLCIAIIGTFLLCVFSCAVLLDQGRKMLWKWLSPYVL